jgi:hypothetical protein
MVLTRGAHRRVRFGRRKWLLGLPVVALVCFLALGASATSAPQGVSVSFTVTTSPCTWQVEGTWTAVPGQAFIHDQVIDQRTGGGPDITVPVTPTQTTGGVNGSSIPLEKGRHHYKATITIEDASHNPLLTGSRGKSLPCFN